MGDVQQATRQELDGSPDLMLEQPDAGLRDSRWVQALRDGVFEISGDVTGCPVLYVYCDGDHLLSDPDPGALFDAVKSRGLSLEVSPEAVSHFLTAGLIPYPLSIFRHVYALGVGDRLRATQVAGKWTCEHSVDFPYYSEQSSGESIADPRQLLALLTQAVQVQIGDSASPTLMLSSGKDSTALAACFAELGRRDVQCLTFVAETDADEDGYAKALCDRLGFAHERVSVPLGQPFPEGVMRSFFSAAPLPCADDCQIPYVYAMSKVSGSGGCIVDGSGNDVYVGHVPSKNDRRRDWMYMRNRPLARTLERLVPCCTRGAQLLRNRAELCFLLGLFRGREVHRFYQEYVDAEAFWQHALDELRGRDVFDFRAVMRGRHYDQGSCALKATVASAAFGMRSAFPWCDDAVSQYYFNLPQASRYDQKQFVNKLLVRDMLSEAIDYPADTIGKRYFQFDRIAFFTANRELVRSEILGCSLWNRKQSERLLNALYGRLPHNRRVGVALNSWFLLSGWLNHNRWMNS
ncbi:MAG: hypothetical protein HN341_14645 [Verrucomicrobia bacterium]|jgi:asparagine synthase (glutamine-hydrolysing)|nr:hypothetical protein [Verrucomicrobiota bacterium]